MAGAAVSVRAEGWSYPPDRKLIVHNGRVEWHKVECPVPDGKCLDAPLKSGCSRPPTPEEQ
jgi:hypothetical protein